MRLVVLVLAVVPCTPMCAPPLPPLSRGLPLFGDTLKLLSPKSMASYQVDGLAKHGPMWRTRLLFQDAVVVTSTDALADLASEERNKPTFAFFPPQQKALFGPDSLLVNSGAKHATLRRLVGQALSPAAIASYAPTIDAAVEECIGRCIEKSADGDVALADEMRLFTLRVGAQLILGEVKARGDIVDTLVEDLSTWSKGLVAPPLFFLPWSAAARARRARRRIEAVLNPLIEDARAGASAVKGGTLLQRLARVEDEETGALEQSAIVDNLLTLLFAGSDTTASGLTSCFKELALAPQLQADIRNTVATRPADVVDSTLNALVAEVHRTNPPAPFQVRQVGQQDLEVGGCCVPANSLVVYGYAGAMVDSATYTNPSDLDIQRWLSDAALPTWSFGGGPRMCPGKTLALAETLALLKRALGPQGLEWTLTDNQDLSARYTPGLFPVDRLRARVGVSK